MIATVHDILSELRPCYEAGREWAADVPFVPPVTTRDSRVKITARTISCSPNADGTAVQVPIKIYEPAERGSGILPAMLFCHGGGYMAGHPDADDPLCEEYVLGANCVVVAVDYRLAPRYRYPAALEDCYAALVWLAAQTGPLHLDPAHLAVAGASAGGGLAAALALYARDHNGPHLCFQMPLYPMLDDRCNTPSSYEITRECLPKAWTRTNNLFCWDNYLRTLRDRGEETPIYAAPARAADLTGLPPAYLCVGQLDLFRDEVIDYAARLARAGIPVEFHLYPGCFHGHDSVYNDCDAARLCRKAYIAAIGKALHQP